MIATSWDIENFLAWWGASSTPGEDWRAAFGEGAHAFFLVLRVEQQLERLAFQLQAGGQAGVGAGQGDPLDLAHRNRRSRGDQPRQLQGARIEAFVVDHLAG